MNITMYDKLLRLPLFQGLSRSDLTDILGKVKVEFRRYDKKEYIVKQGEPCAELIYILGGSIKASSKDSVHNFTLYEMLGSNTIIEPYSLFGMYNSYQFSYRAECESDIIIVKKEYILSTLCKYEIFNLNYLNVLSNRTQNMHLKLWNTHIGSTTEKIVNFLLLRCEFPQGAKELSIKMEDLANLIDETRINVSRSLNALQDKGLIDLSRKSIKIFDLRRLLIEIFKLDLPMDVSEQLEESLPNRKAEQETHEATHETSEAEQVTSEAGLVTSEAADTAPSEVNS